MDIGQRVSSDLYSDHGIGVVITKDRIFGQEFCEIFFESTEKIIKIPLDSLKPIDKSIDLFRSQNFSPPEDFRLNFLAHSLESLATGEKKLSPANFKINPLPHQLLALDFVIEQFKPRCLLADEVGLGKTIEAALIMEELKLRNIVKRALIVSPAGLTNQWQDELKLKFSEDFSIVDSDTFKSFKQLYGKDTNCWLKFDNIITSIDFLKPKKIHDGLTEYEKKRRHEHNRYVFEDCINANWDIVIIDEAHKLSKYHTGEETARFKVGDELSRSVPIFLILTATPHRGKPDVFLNLLKLVDPYGFNKIVDLKPENVRSVTVRNKKRACVDFEGNLIFKNRTTSLCKIKWDKNIDSPEIELYEAVIVYIAEYYNYARQENNSVLILLLMLYQRIVSSSSRAMLKSLERRFETLKSWVEKIKTINESPDDFFEIQGEKQLKILERIMPILNKPELVEKEIKIISLCIDLAKKAVIGRTDAKLRKLIEIIDELKRSTNDSSVKVIVFTEFIETQKYIIESLNTIGYKTAFINGSLDITDKIIQKQKFKNEAQVMVSTDAGSEGINLQFCHVVINYDLPWNPMQIEQRIGRVDRIGQDKDVIAINFILEDTIEEYVRDKIEYKLQLIKEQFGEDKLQDVLFTLNEEFDFEKLYIQTIAKGKTNNSEIDAFAEEIYQKSKQIIENSELLIPFSEKEKNTIDIEEIKDIAKKNFVFTKLFLENRGIDIHEYKENKDLFYFKNDFKPDILKNKYTKIIFDQRKGMDFEDSELFCITHPFIQESIAKSKNLGKTSNMCITYDKFKGINGLLFNWLFTISNNFNLNYQYLLSIFLDDELKFNRRVSEFLQNIENLPIASIDRTIELDLDKAFQVAFSTAGEISENIFLEKQNSWLSKIDENRLKIDKYFQQKADAINQIKIVNIRESKKKELSIERNQKIIELSKQSSLIPNLECIQIAGIYFR